MQQNNSPEIKLLTFLNDNHAMDTPIRVNPCIDSTDLNRAKILIQQLLEGKYITVTSTDYLKLGVDPYNNLMAYFPKNKHETFNINPPDVYACITEKGIEHLKALQ